MYESWYVWLSFFWLNTHTHTHFKCCDLSRAVFNNVLYIFLTSSSGNKIGGASSRYDRTPISSGMTPMHSRTPMYGSQTPQYDGSRTPHYGGQTPSHEPGSMTPGRSGAWDPTLANTPVRYTGWEKSLTLLYVPFLIYLIFLKLWSCVLEFISENIFFANVMSYLKQWPCSMNPCIVWSICWNHCSHNAKWTIVSSPQCWLMTTGPLKIPCLEGEISFLRFWSGISQ